MSYLEAGLSFLASFPAGPPGMSAATGLVMPLPAGGAAVPRPLEACSRPGGALTLSRPGAPRTGAAGP